MTKLIDSRWVECERTAHWLARMCYPIALSIEVKQPATTLKLLEAVHAARYELYQLTTTFRRKSPARKVERARKALKCARAILKRLGEEEPKEAARVTAAHEVAERLIGMLETPAP